MFVVLLCFVRVFAFERGSVELDKVVCVVDIFYYCFCVIVVFVIICCDVLCVIGLCESVIMYVFVLFVNVLVMFMVC